VGREARIVLLDFPTSTSVNTRVQVKMTGRVTSNDDDRTAFFVMFYYLEGPADSVETSCGEMPKCNRYVCVACGKFTERGASVGTEFTYEGWVKYPTPGQYRFRVVAGWFIDPIAYDFTDRRDVYVSVSPPPTPSPTTPSTIDTLLVAVAGVSAFLSSFINAYSAHRRRR
jgi:hypothetical protein